MIYFLFEDYGKVGCCFHRLNVCIDSGFDLWIGRESVRRWVEENEIKSMG